MKKLILSAFVLAVATMSVQAQDQPHRKQGRHGGRHHKEAFHKLNLSEEQKTKFKTLNEDFRKQMQELKKNDNITVKEWKSKMSSLRTDHRTQMQGLLTTEQKAQLEKTKQDRMAARKAGHEARMEKMKTRLGLSADQVEKMKASRTELGAQMKALHENKSLNEEQKKEQMKELRKKQKDSFKSILTEDQLKKLHEKQKHRPAKQPV
jgi:Spy/CpxP family protein refolding chaperone